MPQIESLEKLASPDMAEQLGPALYMSLFMVLVIAILIIPLFSRIYSKNAAKIDAIYSKSESRLNQINTSHSEKMEGMYVENKDFVVSTLQKFSKITDDVSKLSSMSMMTIQENNVILKEFSSTLNYELKGLRDTNSTLLSLKKDQDEMTRLLVDVLKLETERRDGESKEAG